ncbi:hypothetical protein MTO96_012032 [Rhipicephalus appendiculatus]
MLSSLLYGHPVVPPFGEAGIADIDDEQFSLRGTPEKSSPRLRSTPISSIRRVARTRRRRKKGGGVGGRRVSHFPRLLRVIDLGSAGTEPPYTSEALVASQEQEVLFLPP